MVDGFIRVPVDDTGKRVDAEELTVAALTVQRQRVQIGGTADTEIAPVSVTAGLKVDLGADNDVTVASLPLPTGAATAALQLPDGHNVTVDNASIAITAAALPLPAGAATSAAQLPDGHNVTVDNAAGAAAVNIQDGGNSLTIDAATLPLPTGASTAAGQLPDGHNVTVDNAAAAPVPAAVTTTADVVVKPGDSVNNAVRVNIVAGGGSGGTSATDNTAFTGGSTAVTPMGAVFDATPPAITDGNVGAPRMSANRDLHTLLVTDDGSSAGDDANNAIRVNVVAGSSGGPSKVDDAAFSVAVDSVAPMGALADETATDPVDEGDVGIPRMTLDRKLLTRVVGSTDANRMDVDGSGHAQVDIAASSVTVTVDGSGVTQPISAVSLPLPTGAATSAAQLPDGHNVTVDNGAGAAAVNVQDGGNSITIDATSLPLPTGAATAAAQLPDGHNVTIDNAGGGAAVNVQDGGNSLTIDGTVTASNTAGDIAHDGVDSGNPLKVGYVARAFSAAPGTVSAAGDRVDAIATAQGIQYVLGGHPNIITREFVATAAQTNVDMLGAVAAGSKVVVTGLEAMVSNATTVNVKVRIGFGTTTVPTEPTTGNNVAGMALVHPNIAPGSGVVRGSGVGIIAVGASDEELRISSSVATGGQLTVLITYYVSTV